MSRGQQNTNRSRKSYGVDCGKLGWYTWESIPPEVPKLPERSSSARADGTEAFPVTCYNTGVMSSQLSPWQVGEDDKK